MVFKPEDQSTPELMSRKCPMFDFGDNEAVNNTERRDSEISIGGGPSFTSKMANKGYIRQQETEYEKHKNKELVKKLLAEFDMEETEDFYLSRDAVEFEYDPGDFSVNSSQSTLRIKQNLFRLMGTDVIKLNDKRYSDKLRRKLQEEYEAHMNKKEKDLEEAEKQRLRRLMLEGIIPMENEIDKNSKKGNNTRKKKQTQKKKKHRCSQQSIMDEDSESYKAVMNKKKEKEKSDDEKVEEQSIEEQVVTQVQLVEQSESQQEIQRSKPEGQEQSRVDSPNNRQQSTGETQQKTDETSQYRSESPYKDQRNVLKDETREQEQRQHSSPTPRGKYSLKESSRVLELRQEETVDGLYELAERLVVYSS